MGFGKMGHYAVAMLCACTLAAGGMSIASTDRRVGVDDGSLSQTIALRVVDQRGEQGRAGHGAQLVPAVLREAVADHLRHRGFLVVDSSEPAAHSLYIVIRQFEYERLVKGNGIGIRTQISVGAADGSPGPGRGYSSKTVHSTPVPPSDSNDEEWIRLGLKDALPRIYGDPRFAGLVTR